MSACYQLEMFAEPEGPGPEPVPCPYAYRGREHCGTGCRMWLKGSGPYCALSVLREGEVMTLSEIGEVLGVSREMIRLIERDAVTKLRGHAF